MNDPMLQRPMDAQNDRHLAHAAGIPADDDLLAAFGSEHEPPPAPRSRPRDGSTGLDLEDLALSSHENPLSLFASEEASPSVPMFADLRPTAPVPPQPAATRSRTRARRRVAVTPVALSAMALVAVLGAAAFVTMLVSGRHGVQVASIPAGVATTPSVAAPVVRPVGPPIVTDEPLAEPIKPAGDSGEDSPAGAPRAAVETLLATNVARSPAPVTVQATKTAPATGQPPPSTVAAAAAAPALDPGETLPAVNARPVSPDVASTSGVVVPPRVVATAGTLPAAPAPAAAPVAAAVTAPPPATGSASVVAETAAIESVLSRYAAAFTARDVVAAKSVWPRVNERGLLKAFESVEEQQFDLGACVITANVAQAVALCDGTARYVPKVGSKRMRSEVRRWTFRLGQRDGDWSIETVEFR